MRNAPVDRAAVPATSPDPVRLTGATVVPWLRARLPRGRTLTLEEWWRRHRAILAVLWAHTVGIPLFALFRGYTPAHGLLETLPVAIPALAATLPSLGRTLRTQAAAFGLLSSSAVLVHLSGGTIEMHFHFFVMVTVVALYQEWFPFLMAIGYVFMHHGILGLLDPRAVYNHPAALNDPWKWAAIHALFISGISAVCLITWRVNETALAHRRRAEEDAERLYELEAAARAAAEAARARLEVLSETSRVLVSSLDLDETLQGAAALWVPQVADVCSIDVIDGSDHMRRFLAVAPGIGAREGAFEDRAPHTARETHPAVRVTRSGNSELLRKLSEEDLAAFGEDLAEVRAEAASAIVVPLVGRQEMLGAISFLTTPSRDAFAPGDLSLAEELARRTAAAIENALLYARERGVAETLQRSLLPESLPSIPGLTSAARYSPGGPDLEVGGDWYDVLVLPGGTVAFALGDVVGRGLPAATLMGQLRNALRAYALEGFAPAPLLERLNRIVQSNHSDHLATLVYGLFDLGSGTLRLANAGHPPPLVVGPDGSAAYLDGQHCLPLGAMPFAEYSETVTSLAPGATLILYTDGLVEDRDTPLHEGLRRLAQTAGNAPSDVEELAEYLEREMVAGRDVDDDVALLVLRPGTLDNPLVLRLPAQPRMLASLRSTLRRWLAERGASDEEISDILVACGEASANAIEHASRTPDAWFEIHAEAGETVHITVRDNGRWRTPRPRGGGRGLHVIEALSDRMELVKRDEGTEVHLWRRLANRQLVR